MLKEALGDVDVPLPSRCLQQYRPTHLTTSVLDPESRISCTYLHAEPTAGEDNADTAVGRVCGSLQALQMKAFVRPPHY